MEKRDDFQIIHTYSRRQAIKDRMLFDISNTAKEYGFKIPVAITRNLLYRYIDPSEACEKIGQSLSGRLIDVLTVLYFEARRTKGDRLTFKVAFVMDAETGRSETVDLLAVVGPGDEGEPVLTIMLPEDE